MRFESANVAVIYFFALPLYLFFLHPSINWKDSGELVTGGHLLTPLHFPGYPMYAQLAKLFSFIPLGSIANRISLLNVVCGATVGALLLQGLAIQARTVAAPVQIPKSGTEPGGRPVSGFPGIGSTVGRFLPAVFVLALLLSPTFQEESTIAENTMPFITLLALSLLHPFTFDSRRSLAAGLWPLCLFLSYHLLFFVVGAAALLFVSLVVRSPHSRLDRLVVLVSMTFLAASSYLFIPLRTDRPVRLSETGVSTKDELRAVLHSGLHKRAIKSDRPDDSGWFSVGAGRLLGKSNPSESELHPKRPLGLPPGSRADQAGVPGEESIQPLDVFRRAHFKSEYIVFLIPFWLLGMLWLARKAPAAGFIQAIVFIILLGATASQAGQETRGQSLPLVAYAASWAGATALWSARHRGVIARSLGGILILAGVFALARNLVHVRNQLITRTENGRSQPEREPTILGDRIVAGLAPESLVMISYPRMATMFYYYLYVENRRPDLEIVVEPLLVSPYYRSGEGWENSGHPEGRTFLDFHGDAHKRRILSISTSAAARRAVYRDSSFYQIKLGNLHAAALTPDAWAKVDWTRVRLDPWEPLKLLLRSVKAEDLATVLQTSSDAPGLSIRKCGLLFQIDTGKSGTLSRSACSPVNWPPRSLPLDTGTREVLAFYGFREGIFLLGTGDAPAASEAFKRAVDLNPQSPL